MHIDFRGCVVNEPEIRAGVVGCGSHAFRNIFPCFQFAHVNLLATCDLDQTRAETYARRFGADHAFTDYRRMLERVELDAVFVILGYDDQGRPQYPQVAIDCMERGAHVWIEKPPAATVAEIDRMADVAAATGRQAMVGFKKMFFQPNRKAKSIMGDPAFGNPVVATLHEPHAIPTSSDYAAYLDRGEYNRDVLWFLDHVCHPVSAMVYLFGGPETMTFQRCDRNGAGVATFCYAGDGPVVSVVFTAAQADNGGRDRILIVSDRNQHVVVDNNLRVMWHRGRAGQSVFPYGATPDFYAAPPEQASAVWEPEFSLGQLYNKGIFLLGYYGEIEHFAQAILADRPVEHGTLAHARTITRIFQAFASGPDKTIRLA